MRRYAKQTTMIDFQLNQTTIECFEYRLDNQHLSEQTSPPLLAVVSAFQDQDSSKREPNEHNRITAPSI